MQAKSSLNSRNICHMMMKRLGNSASIPAAIASTKKCATQRRHTAPGRSPKEVREIFNSSCNGLNLTMRTSNTSNGQAISSDHRAAKATRSSSGLRQTFRINNSTSSIQASSKSQRNDSSKNLQLAVPNAASSGIIKTALARFSKIVKNEKK